MSKYETTSVVEEFSSVVDLQSEIISLKRIRIPFKHDDDTCISGALFDFLVKPVLLQSQIVFILLNSIDKRLIEEANLFCNLAIDCNTVPLVIIESSKVDPVLLHEAWQEIGPLILLNRTEESSNRNSSPLEYLRVYEPIETIEKTLINHQDDETRCTLLSVINHLGICHYAESHSDKVEADLFILIDKAVEELKQQKNDIIQKTCLLLAIVTYKKTSTINNENLITIYLKEKTGMKGIVTIENDCLESDQMHVGLFCTDGSYLKSRMDRHIDRINNLNIALVNELRALETAYSFFAEAIKSDKFKWLELAHEVSDSIFEFKELFKSLKNASIGGRVQTQIEINNNSECLKESLHNLLTEENITPNGIQFIKDEMDSLKENFPDSAKVMSCNILRFESTLQDIKHTLTELYELTSIRVESLK